jgi:hypothetical protein
MSYTKFVALIGALALPLAAVAADPSYDQTPTAGQSTAGDPPGAQGRAGDTMSPMFQQLDADHDGSVSTTEAEKSATVKSKFKSLDTNHDGKISPDEWKAGRME